MKKSLVWALLALLGMMGNGAWAVSSLTAGQGLYPGQQLDSDNGLYMLVLQASDGNLVVYRKADMAATWATNKYGGNFAVIQADRNFVVYKPGAWVSSNAIWSSRSNANVSDPGARLTLGDDGFLRVTDGNNNVVWTTAGPCAGGAQMQTVYVCYQAGTPYQFQTLVLACPGTFIGYPYTVGVCPFVPN